MSGTFIARRVFFRKGYNNICSFQGIQLLYEILIFFQSTFPITINSNSDFIVKLLQLQ